MTGRGSVLPYAPPPTKPLEFGGRANTLRVCSSLLELIGNTPVLRIGPPLVRPGRGFWAKLEGCNPGGIKDRAAVHMIHRARERGELGPGQPIVESTSGTYGLGLALVGVALGHPVVLVTDPGMELCMRQQLAAYGVRVEVVEEPHSTGGWQEARRRRLLELLAESPGAYWPNQYDNPDNVDGYAALAEELVAQLGRIDVVVCSVGTGGHSAGIAAVLRGMLPQVQMVGVDSVGSTIFGQPARPRLMRGLGSSIYPRNVAYDAFDEIHWVSPTEAVYMCRRLARSSFMTGGWSTGAVALVARWLSHVLPADRCIAAIFPDGPHRYWGSIYDEDFCARNGLLPAPPAIEPDEIKHPMAREVTRWTRCTAVVDPVSDRPSLAGSAHGTKTEPGPGR